MDNYVKKRLFENSNDDTKTPSTRIITINGVAQNLSLDRTWTVTDANISTSDITTNNVSITKHGFAPKLPNDATKYLDGTGAYSIPASTPGNLTGAITSVGLATSLGSFTSLQLLGALSDETGTGSAVFANTPTLITPNIGAATGTSLVTTGAISTGAALTGNEPNSTATNRGYTLNTRNVAVAFPVPTIRPTTVDTVLAVDLMPNGSPVENANGFTWFDVCTADILNSNVPTCNSARVAATSTGAEISSRLFNGAAALPLKLRVQTGTSTVVDSIYVSNTGKKVGFNTTSPNYSVHIHEDLSTTAVSLQITNGSSGTAATDGINIGIDNAATPNAYFINRENSNLSLWTNAVQRFTLSGAGALTHTPGVSSTGAVTNFTYTGSANTGQTTGSEIPGVLWTTTSRQWAGSTNISLQREFYITTPTYSSASATKTITDAFTFYADAGPTAGTNSAITRSWSAGFNGRVGIATNLYIGNLTTAATSLLHLAAGSTGQAPISLTTGPLTTGGNILAGQLQFLTDEYYVTITTGTAVRKIGQVLTGSATLDFPNTLAQTDSDLTIAVAGAVVGDPCEVAPPTMPPTGSTFTAFVSAADTVTVRFSVYGITAKDPASGTYNVIVHKNR